MPGKPGKPGGNGHETHRATFDTCASGSPIAPELLDKYLKGYAKKSRKKSKWKTKMSEFLSEGTSTFSKAVFPSFSTQRQLDIEFNSLPRQENHSCHTLIGMRDSKRLGIVVGLKEETMKWDGISIPMSPKGH